VGIRRILLVDDEDDIRFVASATLQHLAGWDVTSVGSGEEAVAAVQSDAPDAVVLDVMMPGMDGPATLAALRRTPGIPEVPVVFLTAKVQAGERRRLESLGAAGVIAKPFDPALLPEQVASVLGWA
jgi:CheY-like chemotaxis protein